MRLLLWSICSSFLAIRSAPVIHTAFTEVSKRCKRPINRSDTSYYTQRLRFNCLYCMIGAGEDQPDASVKVILDNRLLAFSATSCNPLHRSERVSLLRASLNGSRSYRSDSVVG